MLDLRLWILDLRVLIYDVSLLIEMMFLDIFIDRFRKIIAERLAVCDSASYLAGGDLKEWRFHIMDLGTDAG
jgi:hypothetical protein